MTEYGFDAPPALAPQFESKRLLWYVPKFLQQRQPGSLSLNPMPVVLLGLGCKELPGLLLGLVESSRLALDVVSPGVPQFLPEARLQSLG